ncbi:MAG: TIGR03067 domain-containing protein [Deltaproteobacteria bacterium]|nr:TIGR03067 domain-containing protein [Deltaproteobacteria bacterium]
MHNQPLVESGNRNQSQSARDLAALQGSWEQVCLEADGVSNPPDAHSAPGALTTFAGERFEVRTVDGTLLLAGTFTLDASTRPTSITWIDSMGEDMGRPLPAIYKLEGDNFVFVAANEGAPRPCIFKTTQGETMRVFVRRR